MSEMLRNGFPQFLDAHVFQLFQTCAYTRYIISAYFFASSGDGMPNRGEASPPIAPSPHPYPIATKNGVPTATPDRNTCYNPSRRGSMGAAKGIMLDFGYLYFKFETLHSPKAPYNYSASFRYLADVSISSKTN